MDEVAAMGELLALHNPSSPTRVTSAMVCSPSVITYDDAFHRMVSRGTPIISPQSLLVCCNKPDRLWVMQDVEKQVNRFAGVKLRSRGPFLFKDGRFRETTEYRVLTTDCLTSAWENGDLDVDPLGYIEIAQKQQSDELGVCFLPTLAKYRQFDSHDKRVDTEHGEAPVGLIHLGVNRPDVPEDNINPIMKPSYPARLVGFAWPHATRRMFPSDRLLFAPASPSFEHFPNELSVSPHDLPLRASRQYYDAIHIFVYTSCLMELREFLFIAERMAEGGAAVHLVVIIENAPPKPTAKIRSLIENRIYPSSLSDE